MVVLIWQDDETKPPLVKKEEPDAVVPKEETIETEEKKPEMKAEPKEEEESAGNSTSATSIPQNRKKSKNINVICRKAGPLCAQLGLVPVHLHSCICVKLYYCLFLRSYNYPVQFSSQRSWDKP